MIGTQLKPGESVTIMPYGEDPTYMGLGLTEWTNTPLPMPSELKAILRSSPRMLTPETARLARQHFGGPLLFNDYWRTLPLRELMGRSLNLIGQGTQHCNDKAGFKGAFFDDPLAQIPGDELELL